MSCASYKYTFSLAMPAPSRDQHPGSPAAVIIAVSDMQTVQVSRFQRDPPDFTRSIPFPDAPPSGVYKIPLLILFLEASRTMGASTCVPSVHACILYCIYCTTMLSNCGNTQLCSAVYSVYVYIALKPGLLQLPPPRLLLR